VSSDRSPTWRLLFLSKTTKAKASSCSFLHGTGVYTVHHHLIWFPANTPSQSDVKSVENLRYLLACCLTILFLLALHPAGILAKALKVSVLLPQLSGDDACI
jgi:hypothetical protein